MNQLSKATDRKLNELSRIIGIAEVLIEKGTAKKDKTWEEVFSFLAEHDQKRFVADDGYSLAMQERQAAPKLDESRLKTLMIDQLGPNKAGRAWTQITIDKVDSKLLEAAVKDGRIPAEIVDQCITLPDPTYARVRRVWTKEDTETAAVTGVQIDPMSREEEIKMMEEIIYE